MSNTSVEQKVRDKLTALQPKYLELLNESHNHSVPIDSETHFKVVLVSDVFNGLSAVKRHQSVYGVLEEEISGPIHALALHCFTPEEWALKQQSPDSPPCLGGG